MKKTITFAAIAAASFISLNANSAVFGSYVKSSQAEFDLYHAIHSYQAAPGQKDVWNSPLTWPEFYPFEMGNLNHPDRAGTYGICVDNTSRKVPGKLADDGYCYVEWKGENWRNSEYLVLQQDYDYSWRKIGKNYKLKGDEVTAGGWDAGNYSYHCIAESEYAGRYRYRVLGKYIPSHNRCYIGLGRNKRDTAAVEIGALLPSITAGSYPYAYNHAWILVAPNKSGGGNGGGSTPIDPPYDDCFSAGRLCP